MKKDCWPDVAFEVSWEVCNKVGGIHTVMSTKVPEMEQRLGEQYITVGPDIWRGEDENPEFIEDPSLFKGWQRAAVKQGLKLRTGRWNVASKPYAIIVDFTPFMPKKDEIFSKAWETWKLDSLNGSWDYVEAALFGYTAGMLIKSFTDYYRSNKAIAHFHEWMTGMGVLYLAENAPYIGKVFTTHATVMGRSLAGNGFALYEKLTEFNTEELSNQLGVNAKHSLEKLAAENAETFTTVSEITARECEKFLSKKPDFITPNGFDPKIVPPREELLNNKTKYRETLLKIASACIGREIPGDAFIIGTSGRYEFRNKGYDLFVESLSKLNQNPDLKRSIVAFIMVPANHYRPRHSVLDRLNGINTEVKGSPYLTHDLHQEENDPIINSLKNHGLKNLEEDKVTVIFVPSYLNGHDGILNLEYYEALMGLDMSVFPSYYEPWGYTPLESLIFGVPTVTTNLAGFGMWLREQFPEKEGQPFKVMDRLSGNNGGIVELIVGKIVEWAALDKSGFEKLIVNAREIALTAGWSTFFSFYEDAYCDSLKKVGAMKIPERDAEYQREENGIVLSRISNEPIWTDVIVESKLPERLEGLNDLAKNLWWSWNYKAEEIFSKLDEELWVEVEKNPKKLLQIVPFARLESLVENKEFMDLYDQVMNSYNEYMSLQEEAKGPLIAYFSMEYGFHSSLKIYSGGLGVLAGDYLKEASDSNVKLFGVGLLYRHGYFRQQLTLSGEQISDNIREEFSDLPVCPVFNENNEWITVQVAFPGRIVSARVWKCSIGRINLYLLDTDIEENNSDDRHITANLYGGDEENRLKQELILGVGGVRMINKLGLKPYLYHCNEGHAAFIGLERLRRLAEMKLFRFEDSLEIVRASTLFTTHTPVPAGHDSFPEDLIRSYMGHYPSRLNISWDEFINLGKLNPGNTSEKFSMSYLASRLSQEMNAVSKLHSEVTKSMFNEMWKGYYPEELHIGYVTNGVHYKTWTAKDWQELHLKTFGEDFNSQQSNPDIWDAIYNVPDEEIWTVKEDQRTRLMAFIRERLLKHSIKRHDAPSQIIRVLGSLDDQTLTIGFARRFATYKRANLLFKDTERLASIVNKLDMPVQFIFAGKAHPRDKAGQDIIRNIIEISRRPEFIGKVVFLEDYDMEVARHLVQGVDVWLNTPTRPLEASGTSGMKAAMNGVMNFSVLDGWWVEGYRVGAGWALPEERAYTDQAFQDEMDAAVIYDLLENEIIPMFYERNNKGLPENWISHIKNTFAWVAPHFTTKRMIDDYYDRFYSQLEARISDIKVNNYQMARDMAKWKARIASSWDKIKVLDVHFGEKADGAIKVGDNYQSFVKLDINGLEPEELGVELVVTKLKSGGGVVFVYKEEFAQISAEDKHVTYTLDTIPKRAGAFKMGIRIFPKHPRMPFRQDFSYMRWI